jgi:hypothetical protein
MGVKELLACRKERTLQHHTPNLGFGVWGLGFGVWGLGFGVWGLGFEVPV